MKGSLEMQGEGGIYTKVVKDLTNQTQMGLAKKGFITEAMKRVAEKESIAPEIIRREVAKGRLIIPHNIYHSKLDPIGIGIALTTKINANIGTSPLSFDEKEELEKLKVAVQYGADTVMDLSTGGDIDKIRSNILNVATVPIGTVPIYEVAARFNNDIRNVSTDDIMDVILHQAKQGVDFMTIHCGILREYVEYALNHRLTKIVSRGGALLAEWMKHKNEQNPLYTRFDDILEIARKYDVTLSLGDALRPGSIADANDEVQFAELKTLGKLTLRAWEKDVQVMIEGPGHVPIDKIATNVFREIDYCYGAPFYTLGPIVTDIAPGYDHITSAIGAAIAGFYGTSLLCYVTPKEHLGLPTLDDVKEGVIAYKMAAHAIDIARNRAGCERRDREISLARFAFDWDKQFSLSIEPEKARSLFLASVARCAELRKDGNSNNQHFCTMCGPDFCPMNIISKQVPKKRI